MSETHTAKSLWGEQIDSNDQDEFTFFFGSANGVIGTKYGAAKRITSPLVIQQPAAAIKTYRCSPPP